MNPIILYQMGKVGSSTLKESLKSVKIKSMHVHRFYFNNKERKLSYRDKLQKIKQNIVFDKLLLNKKEKVKIFTFYRDPLQRNISSFFQNLEYYFNSEELKELNYNILEKKFIKSTQIHNTPNNWFDIEFKRKTGINIYDYPLNKDKGYTIISARNIEVFVCCTNKINQLEKEIKVFLNSEKFKLKSTNVGNQKWYKDLYKEFKLKYIPSVEMIENLYSSKVISHFYTEEEVIKMKAYWLDKKDETLY
jgi:hypothetical protein